MRHPLLRVASLSVIALLYAGSASAQTGRGAMTLVLIDDAGKRSAPFAVLGGTIVVSRIDPGNSSGNATDKVAPDRADLALDASVATDPRLLNWLAKSGSQAQAEVTVGGGKTSTVYLLSGINSRVITDTRSSEGAGQTSLVFGAEHGAENGIAIN